MPSYEELMAKSIPFKKIKGAGLESSRLFQFHKPPGGVPYTAEQVYRRANHIRKKLQEKHPGKYGIYVSVLDINSKGGWRGGGKFTRTDDPNIRFFTPDEYDKHYNKGKSAYPAGKVPELAAEKIHIYVARFK